MNCGMYALLLIVFLWPVPCSILGCSLFDLVSVATTEGHWYSRENDRVITTNVVYREVFEVSRIHKLFARLQLVARIITQW